MCWRSRRLSRVDGGRFPRDRQGEKKLRSATRLGLDPDLPAVRLDDSLRDRQSEAGAEALGAFGLPVGIEDVLEVFLRDSGTRVRDREQHMIVLRIGAECDHPTLWGELHRVADQVR